MHRAVGEDDVGERAVPLRDAVQPLAQPFGRDAQPAAATGGGTGSGHPRSIAGCAPDDGQPNRAPSQGLSPDAPASAAIQPGIGRASAPAPVAAGVSR